MLKVFNISLLFLLASLLGGCSPSGKEKEVSLDVFMILTDTLPDGRPMTVDMVVDSFEYNNLIDRYYMRRHDSLVYDVSAKNVEWFVIK